MRPQLTTIMPEMIDCISEGREPNDDELRRVADRIWTDVHGAASVFAWAESRLDDERQLTMRAASAALSGV